MLSFCHFCTVTDFSAAEKARGVKFCTRVGLLSGQVLSPFGELWLAGSHGGGIISGMNRYVPVSGGSQSVGIPDWVPWLGGAFGIGGGGLA